MKALEESKCLASLAVFRELYNSQKDIYGVIGEFLKEIISTNAKYQFSLTEITNLLNDTYDFKIPEAVVGTSLSRFKNSFQKEHGFYTISDINAFSITGKLTTTHANVQSSNNVIIKSLFEFIEAEKKAQLSDSERGRVVHSFCSFIIDESTAQEFSEYVSAFIVRGKGDEGFTQQLNIIKEGVVLYTGIKFNSSLNDLGSWNSELTIFIETEILFHFAGYNGRIFQVLFEDFFSLVKEINTKSVKKTGKPLIQLKYFTEVKDEIERFFKKAEYIVSGKDKANPSKTAMTSIIDGCQSPAEVIEKKTRFFELLRSNSIHEDEYRGYYSEQNFKYNIEDAHLLESLSKRLEVADLSSYLRFLNYINIHRRGVSDRGFENVGCVLLSGTTVTLQVAWDEEIKPSGNVPLASSLSFLTNKLWFRLNKGFGKGDYPKSFDIVTKAQIVLSTQLNNSVADKFDELQGKFRQGNLTEEQAVASISELRRQAKKPEDIHEDDIQDVLRSIEESSIEKYLQEQELFKNNAKRQEEENVKLKTVLEEKHEEIARKKREYDETIKEKDRENREKESELQRYRNQEREKQERRQRLKQIGKRILFITIGLICLTGGVFSYNYFNKALGIVTGTIAGIFTVLSFFKVDYKSIQNLWNKKK